MADTQKTLGDFRKELLAKRVWNDLESCNDFGKAIGVTGKTWYKCQNYPTLIRMDTMQKIVKVLKPDIGIMLRFLGYSDKEINAYAKELMTP